MGQIQGGLGQSEGDIVECDWLKQLKMDQKDIKNWEAVRKRITTNVTRLAEGQTGDVQLNFEHKLPIISVVTRETSF